MKAKHHLEHVIFNSWVRKNLSTAEVKILVSVSGGRDSMALLRGLVACFSKQKLVVVHCHHGEGENSRYRDEAQKLVQDFCQQNQLECDVYKSKKALKSEAEFREFRLESLQSAAKKYKTQIVALAHHRDDWLETQMLKLIRGSSLDSLKKSFQWSELKSRGLTMWRPFSNHTRLEVDVYRQERGISFVEDPSNQDNRYLRNWLRNDWLPRLEKARPGGVNRLALSLVHSLSEIKPSQDSFPWDLKTNSIDFIYFLSLSSSEKLRCLAFYVRSKGISGIKASQLKEIIRQLDKNSDHCHIHFKTFECLVNAGQLVIKQQ